MILVDWPILQQCQFRSLSLLYGKKAKQWIFSSLKLKGCSGAYRIVSGLLSIFVSVVVILSSGEHSGPWASCITFKVDPFSEVGKFYFDRSTSPSPCFVYIFKGDNLAYGICLLC